MRRKGLGRMGSPLEYLGVVYNSSFSGGCERENIKIKILEPKVYSFFFLPFAIDFERMLVFSWRLFLVLCLLFFLSLWVGLSEGELSG